MMMPRQKMTRRQLIRRKQTMGNRLPRTIRLRLHQMLELPIRQILPALLREVEAARSPLIRTAVLSQYMGQNRNG